MKFSVGSVLARSFAIWFKNLIPFALLSAVVHIPLFIYTWLTIGQIENSPDPAHTIFATGGPGLAVEIEVTDVWTSVNTVAGVVLGNIVAGAIVYGVVEELRGKHAPFGDSVRTGLSRLLPVLATGVIAAILIGLGFLVLVVPGVVAACIFYIAVPAAVCERLGVSDALARSHKLTHGYKVPIFGILAVLALLNWGAGFILETFVDSVAGVKVFALVAVAVDAVLGSLGAVASAVTYATLRQEREGTDVEDLAKVFT